MVRRIWMTLNDRSPASMRGLRLDMYWDGARQPAVSARMLPAATGRIKNLR